MASSVLKQFYGGEGICLVDPVDQFVAKRHAQNKHKHEAVPVFELRKLID